MEGPPEPFHQLQPCYTLGVKQSKIAHSEVISIQFSPISRCSWHSQMTFPQTDAKSILDCFLLSLPDNTF